MATFVLSSGGWAAMASLSAARCMMNTFCTDFAEKGPAEVSSLCLFLEQLRVGLLHALGLADGVATHAHLLRGAAVGAALFWLAWSRLPARAGSGLGSTE